MPICLRCGARYDATDMFCETCGYPVKPKERMSKSNSISSYACTPQKTKDFEVNIPVCIRCGSRIKTADSFCGSCGYPVKGKKQEPIKTNTTQTRTAFKNPNVDPKLIAELDRMHEYFSRVQYLYTEYDNCIRIYWRKRRRNSNEEDTLNSFLAALFLTISIGSLLAGILFFSSKTLLSIVLIIFAFLIGPVGVLFVKKYFQESRASDLIVDVYKPEQARISIELTKHYRNYGHCIISPAYTNPKMIAKIKDNLCSGRANTLKSAISLLYRDSRLNEYMSRKVLDTEIKNNNKYGSNGAEAFLPRDFFVL